jgi:riboflavin kinase/FMN adenylyltransferase
LEVVQRVEVGGQTVSSSRIRQMLAAGRVEEALPMLGRPYRIRGVVVRGAGRGRQIGFPTANVAHIDTLVPGEGIYAGVAWAKDSRWAAALSIGPNPTFDEPGLKVEAYLVGFDGDLYDQPIEIDFLTRLRDIVRYDSVAELVEQIDHDVGATLAVVGRDPAP